MRNHFVHWLREIQRFVNEEKFYAYLLVGLLLIYSLVFVFRSAEPPKISPILAKIKQAEETVKKEKSDREYLREILIDNPVGTVLLSSFGLLFLTGLMGGLVLDGVFVHRLFRRRSPIESVRSGETVDWGMRDLVKVILLFFTFAFGASLVLAAFKRLFFNRWDENFLILLHTTLSDLILFFIILYFVLRKYRRKLEDIGLYFRTWTKDILLGFLGYLAILPIFVIVLLTLLGIATLFSYEPPPHPLVEVFLEEDKRNPLLIVYSIFLACVFGPIIEEVFFRGFCYPALRKLWGIRIATIATAGLFAWIHQSTFAFWPIFVLGVILAYLYEKRGSLIPSITLHIIHNSVFIGYFFLMKRIFLDKFL